MRAVVAPRTPAPIVRGQRRRTGACCRGRDEVAAVLRRLLRRPGDRRNAVADVLLGAAEPGGRLPTTWPAAESDVPVLSTTPVDGTLEYSEGIHIGYRAWLRQGA